MPLFEYTCQECGATDEFLQKFSDPAPEQCPACGATKSMTKEVSLSSFQLKGGGWYKDLYSSTPANSGSDSSSGTSSSSKESSPKSESSKAAAKPSSNEKKTGSGSKKLSKTAA